MSASFATSMLSEVSLLYYYNIVNITKEIEFFMNYSSYNHYLLLIDSRILLYFLASFGLPLLLAFHVRYSLGNVDKCGKMCGDMGTLAKQSKRLILTVNFQQVQNYRF